MHHAEHMRWLFDNALVANWLAFGGGVLGVILVVMLAVGVAERSGLFGALIKTVARWIPQAWLPLLLMFLGIMSSMATDAGYLVLIPLAGLLYAGLGRNPLIGMAAAFAGVSAGFSANLVPGPVDVIVGMNAQVFAESQGIPFTRRRYAAQPGDHELLVHPHLDLRVVGDRRLGHETLRAAEAGAPAVRGPCRSQSVGIRGHFRRASRPACRRPGCAGCRPGHRYAGASGRWRPMSMRRCAPQPGAGNIILLISIFFVITGVFFGVAAGKFRKVWDVADAMVGQMNTMGYILVLTFFCYNFLGLLSYSGLGAYITYLGAETLMAIGLQRFPILLIIGFVITTAIINLVVGGLTSKWMLLGPIFVPMLYFVNPAMTPDLVAAAYRVADSATNIVTPMMTYAGVILAFMRKYRPGLGFGDMLLIMMPLLDRVPDYLDGVAGWLFRPGDTAGILRAVGRSPSTGHRRHALS
jgi:aminobenzoyl-glutamate transport protein